MDNLDSNNVIFSLDQPNLIVRALVELRIRKPCHGRLLSLNHGRIAIPSYPAWSFVAASRTTKTLAVSMCLSIDWRFDKKVCPIVLELCNS